MNELDFKVIQKEDLDPEIEAMRIAYNAIKDLPTENQQGVINYLSVRIKNDYTESWQVKRHIGGSDD